MPEIKGGDGKEPYTIQHGDRSQSFIYPSRKMDVAFSGEGALELAAEQNNMTVAEVLKKLQAGENIIYKSKV